MRAGLWPYVVPTLMSAHGQESLCLGPTGAWATELSSWEQCLSPHLPRSSRISRRAPHSPQEGPSPQCAGSEEGVWGGAEGPLWSDPTPRVPAASLPVRPLPRTPCPCLSSLANSPCHPPLNKVAIKFRTPGLREPQFGTAETWRGGHVPECPCRLEEGS